MLRYGVIPLLVSMGVLVTGGPGWPEQEQDRLKDKVQPYIQAGIDFLQRTQTGSGTWAYLGNVAPTHDQVIGLAALCGIALMENNVPAADQTIQKVYKVVKAAAARDDFAYNYSVSLALMFLDRYHKERIVIVAGQPVVHADSALILKLANKLVNGQATDGRWGYTLTVSAGDNSNTQFAVVALWIARKYTKAPQVDRALSVCEKRLRTSQEPGGGWNYEPSNVQVAMKPTGSMTCAGLLSIALHAGAKRQQQAQFAGDPGQGTLTTKLNDDPAVVKAKAFLVNALQMNTGVQGGGIDTHMTYFLWSLERVATLYRWKKINDVDWFDVGARYLMAKQNRNGSWNMDFLSGEFVDTAFALLFLGKSNLLQPLESADFVGGPLGGGPPPVKQPAAPKKVDSAAQAKELLSKLLNANADKLSEYLLELQEGTSKEYTDTLVTAIQKLPTEAGKALAREALAARLSRKTSKTILEYLEEPERELRLAALTALKAKRELAVCEKILPFLTDQDKGLATEALSTLKSLSNQDFGTSIDRWTRWWDQTQKANKPE